ncbi:helix-turn-helix domain-containing protein [Tomitella cavernea]|uniref:helix-turn-helix domain-containing protein n=1 Tax=Tomitella cavernea TaxID=1387982 RepID=UPI0019036F39
MNEIRALREPAGLSQSELAAKVGMSQPNISTYESGARIPGASTKSRIRAACRPRPGRLLSEHRRETRRLAAERKAHDPRAFGSVARGEDTAFSDLDLLVRFDDDACLFDLVGMTEALSGSGWTSSPRAAWPVGTVRYTARRSRSDGGRRRSRSSRGSHGA